MTFCVLDNSVAMRWCFENAATAYAEHVLEELSHGKEALAPVLWLYEVSAVLAKAQRIGTLSEQKASDFIKALQSLPIRIDREGQDRVFTDTHRLATTYGITGYDAVYLELALRKKLPLATLDEDLHKACLNAGGAIF